MTASKLALMLLVVALSSGAQVLLKIGASGARLAGAASEPDTLGRFASMATSPLVLLGLAMYVAATVAYLRVLSAVDLSQAYTFNALSYVLTMAIGFVWLNEIPHPTRLVGGALILLGVGLIAWR